MKRKPLLIFFASILLILGIGFTAVTNIKHLLETEKDIIRTQKILYNLEQAISYFRDGYINTRNYMITGNGEDTLKRRRAIALYKEELQKVQELIEDSTALTDLNVLKNKIAFHQKNFGEKIIKLRQEKGMDTALAFFKEYSRNGVYNKEIPQSILKIKARLEKLMAQRVAQANEASENAITFIIFGTFTSIIIVLVAIYLIKTDIKKRQKAEEKTKLYSKILEAKNVQLVDFSNIVSHNLRAPMINIFMLIDYIEETEDEREKKLMFEKLKLVVHHLNEVFDELVETLQIKQDTEIESDKIILQECLDTVLIGFEAQIKSSNATIQIDFKEAPIIYYPQKYIDSILANLIGNALKYKSPDRNPVIKITTQKINDSIVLSIADNGLGLDLKMHQHNLFKIRKTFHSHPNAKGFGLFMTKTQIEAMGGKIWAESKPDLGSTFFVEFINQNSKKDTAIDFTPPIIT